MTYNAVVLTYDYSGRKMARYQTGFTYAPMINESHLYEQIGMRLKAIRTSSSSRQLTQEKLAGIVGLERTSITNIEAGKQRVPLHVLYELCNALGVSITEVLPPFDEIAEQPKEKRVQIGGTSYTMPKDIADIVRNI